MLYVATFLSAILNFVASKINTDFLSPDEYGDVKYVLNIIQLVSWVVLFGWLTVMGYMLLTGEPLQWLHGTSWAWASLLALLPTVGSLFFINIAIIDNITIYFY